MMKKNRFWMTLVIALCSITLISMGSCSSDDDPNITTDPDDEEMWKEMYRELDPQLVDSTSIAMYDFYKGIYEGATQSNDPEDENVAAWAKLNMDKLYHVADSVAKAEGGNDYTIAISAFLGRLRLKTTTIEYNTIAADGSKIRLTTLVAWPFIRGWFNPYPDHVVLGCHATIGSNAERPTNFAALDFTSDVSILVGHWASTDSAIEMCLEFWGMPIEPAECLVVMPDYEGFGNTKNRSHPYLNREVQARQCLDAARSGISWYRENEKSLEKNWKLVSIGYSQGGAVSAATYRYYIDNKKSYPGLNYVGALCGDGPYDPFATLKYYCDIDVMDMPCAPAMVIKGLFDSDKEMIASGNKLEDYLTDDFIKTGIFEGIASKTKTTGQLDEMVYGYIAKHPDCTLKYNPAYKGREVRASTVLRPDVFEYIKNGTVPADADRKKKVELLAHCLKKNALIYKSDTENWTPSSGAKFTFYHGKQDIVVPYYNFQSVADAWKDFRKQTRLITYDGGIDGHSEIGQQFFLNCVIPETYLFFHNKWTSAEYTTKETTKI